MMATESESDIEAVALVPETPWTPQYSAALPPPEDAAIETRCERSKYTSPPPMSMTPPPSSQVPLAKRTERGETPTPTSPLLPNGMRESVDDMFSRPTSKQIFEASPAELRDMLEISVVEMDKLDADVHEARMSAAHYKLQHNLLSIETEEASKRMEVEHEMTRREMEVLQMTEHARQTRRDMSSPVQTASARHLMELKGHCQALAEELAVQYKRLDKAKKLLTEKDDMISMLGEENMRLRQRIRENRDHVTKLKSPGGLFAATPRPGHASIPATPQQYRSTPKQTPGRSNNRAGSQEPFAALLLADRVLSQETRASAPSSPSNQPTYRGSVRHTRGVHSMSSLPTTPVRARIPSGQLLPSIQFVPQSEPRQQTAPTDRKSRDSTISASDGEDGGLDSDDETRESGAAQSATAMLRRDPASERSSPFQTGLHQTKLFGSVTKPRLTEKRKHEDEATASLKKARLGEAVGLGIGPWGSPRP